VAALSFPVLNLLECLPQEAMVLILVLTFDNCQKGII
jgi:hypothetical protein